MIKLRHELVGELKQLVELAIRLATTTTKNTACYASPSMSLIISNRCPTLITFK